MLTVDSRRNAYGVNIRGDFWEFDRLYYAIAKYIGEYGADHECPFPEHQLTAQTLLGLSYEIRKGQRGGHELYMQYNGFPHNWFSDPKNLHKIDVDLAKEDYLLDLGLLDDYADNLEDIDLDEIEDDDIQDALLDFDESTVESDPSNGLAYIHYPEATQENTLIQIPMTYSEVIYYALVIEELLSQKDAFWKQKKDLADKDSGWGMDEFYYYGEGHLDIDQLRFFRDEVFSAVYHVIKKDAFVTHLLPLLNGQPLINDTNLREWTGICEKYTKIEMQGEDKIENVVCQVLKELGQARVN